jgi:hypothetical protein
MTAIAGASGLTDIAKNATSLFTGSPTSESIKLVAVFPDGIFAKTNKKELTLPSQFKVNDLNRAVNSKIRKETGKYVDLVVKNSDGDSLVRKSYENGETVQFVDRM